MTTTALLAPTVGMAVVDMGQDADPVGEPLDRCAPVAGAQHPHRPHRPHRAQAMAFQDLDGGRLTGPVRAEQRVDPVAPQSLRG
jgi:hypothetical protein